LTLSNIVLHAGDSLNFVITNPPDETSVRTNFSPAVGSITHISLNQDNRSSTVTFATAGNWTFNNSLSSSTGSIKVN